MSMLKGGKYMWCKDGDTSNDSNIFERTAYFKEFPDVNSGETKVGTRLDTKRRPRPIKCSTLVRRALPRDFFSPSSQTAIHSQDPSLLSTTTRNLNLLPLSNELSKNRVQASQNDNSTHFHKAMPSISNHQEPPFRPVISAQVYQPACIKGNLTHIEEPNFNEDSLLSYSQLLPVPDNELNEGESGNRYKGLQNVLAKDNGLGIDNSKTALKMAESKRTLKTSKTAVLLDPSRLPHNKLTAPPSKFSLLPKRTAPVSLAPLRAPSQKPMVILPDVFSPKRLLSQVPSASTHRRDLRKFSSYEPAQPAAVEEDPGVGQEESEASASTASGSIHSSGDSFQKVPTEVPRKEKAMMIRVTTQKGRLTRKVVNVSSESKDVSDLNI